MIRPSEFTDVAYEVTDGVAVITINRPDRYNALRGRTVDELIYAFRHAWVDGQVGAIVLTGAGEKAFCSGGDQKERAQTGGYGETEMGMFEIERLHQLIRQVPKPVIAAVNGFAIGGGHVLHVICDLTIAADNAVFGQTGPKVGSFDGGFGASYLARIVGQKKAREIWYLCRQYDAKQALEMGLVNTVVPYEQLDAEGVKWAREILTKSPLAIRCLKSAFNAELDGQAGIQELSGNATLLYYLSEEGDEGRAAWNEKRAPNFRKFPWLP